MQASTALTGKKRRRSAALAELSVPFLTGTAVLGASLANFLHYHDYPLLRPEVTVVATGIVLVAALVALLYAAFSPLGRACLEALLVFLAIDLNSDLLWLAFLAAIGTFLLSRLRRTSVLPALGILAGVVLLTTLLGLGERRPPIERIAGTAPTATSAPAILHLILDEHVGLEGLTDPAVRRELAHFYGSRGFRLYSRAYSRHFHTVNAIPDILNFGGSGSSVGSQDGVEVGRTVYLSLLAERGYAINVYESDFANFCSGVSYSSCTRYWSPSLAWIDDLPHSAAEKARLIGYKYWALSSLAVTLSEAYNFLITRPWLRSAGLPFFMLEQRGISSGVSALGALDALTADLRQARPGNVYFAHILLPHYPYVAASDCRIVPPTQWDFRWSSTPLPGREAAYNRQLRCVLRKLDAALDALEASPAGRNAVVVIHGDHGSRITRVEPRADNAGRIRDQDLVAGFSTLFAVRAPRIAAGIDRTPAPAPALLGSLARSGFASVGAARVAPGAHSVMLDDAAWQPRRRVALPRAWQDTRE